MFSNQILNNRKSRKGRNIQYREKYLYLKTDPKTGSLVDDLEAQERYIQTRNRSCRDQNKTMVKIKDENGKEKEIPYKQYLESLPFPEALRFKTTTIKFRGW